MCSVGKSLHYYVHAGINYLGGQITNTVLAHRTVHAVDVGCHRSIMGYLSTCSIGSLCRRWLLFLSLSISLSISLHSFLFFARAPRVPRALLLALFLGILFSHSKEDLLQHFTVLYLSRFMQQILLTLTCTVQYRTVLLACALEGYIASCAGLTR